MAACDSVAGTLASVEGQVTVQSSGTAGWQEAVLNQSLCKGDTVRAGERSRATVVLVNQAVLRIDQNTAMRLDNISGGTEEKSFLSLLKGTLQSFSRKPRSFEVSTPYLNGSIEGTEFVFRTDDAESVLTVFEGTVLASNAQGSVSVTGGQAAAAAAGQAPQARTVVNPRDAAQWSLYYPPVLAAGSDVSATLQQAAADLSVGRVDEARSGVEQAIVSGGADAGSAYALRAVINVVQNHNDLALADARQGVSLSPDSTAAKIALSYAQQANFQLNEARDTLQQAVSQQPANALAHARLSELQLMLGEKTQASASAQQAVSLAPELGRSQITLGFAALAEFRNADATAAFQRAIELDSADPLPHLGLGLARISAGELAAGRGEIELAVGLDSNSALLRAYLGKAYFEEKRGPLDSQQFEIARQLDPNDPTPWFYSGIALQTENRPVQAARELERSVALNDNRATYRGRLLLDQDRAARGTSVARAYRDLGMEQLGINESSRSLTLDPANASAHRYLSDSYRGERRREFSRISELYQAQMLQDININPVQPSISSGNLNIVTTGGPASPGFNEFTPLFQQNTSRFDASAGAGSNNTREGEAVVTVLHDRYSLSLGALNYKTDGFRANNDLDHEIYNIYAQADLAPGINVQAEYSDRNSSNGDLAQNFDAGNFLPQWRRTYDEKTARIGARFEPDQASALLLSVIHSDREEGIDQGQDVTEIPCMFLPEFPFGPCPDVPFTGFTTATDEQGVTAQRETFQYEGQYIHQADMFNMVAGALYADHDSDGALWSISTLANTCVEGFEEACVSSVSVDRSGDTRIGTAYLYTMLSMPAGMDWTAGIGYATADIKFDNPSRLDTGYDRFNPKLGLQWALTEQLDLRAAWFKTVVPVLANKRMLEPMQIAGFSQYYDEASHTRAENFGAGLDWRATDRLALGAESVRRKLDAPANLTRHVVIDGEIQEETETLVIFQDEDEWRHRVYAYWTPLDRWSLTAEAIYDRFEIDNPVGTDIPLEAKTLSYPLKVRYFHPSGLFGLVGVTYVDQKITRPEGSQYGEGDENFTVTDIALGYRLPKRQGIVSLAVQNVFDEDFDYQDDSYRTFEDDPTIGPYIPEMTLMARFTLNF